MARRHPALGDWSPSATDRMKVRPVVKPRLNTYQREAHPQAHRLLPESQSPPRVPLGITVLPRAPPLAPTAVTGLPEVPVVPVYSWPPVEVPEGELVAEVPHDSSQLAEGLNKELTCAICLELFKTPKMLPCLHTFCEECLKQIATQSSNKSVKRSGGPLHPFLAAEAVEPKGIKSCM